MLRRSLAGRLTTKVSPTRTTRTPAPRSDDEPTLLMAATAGERRATRPSEAVLPLRLTLVGGTTAQPVSSKPNDASWLPKKSRRVAFGALSAAAVLLLGGGAMLGFRSIEQTTKSAELPVTPAPPAIPQSTLAGTSPSPLSPSAVSQAPAVPTTPSPPLVSPDQLPIAATRPAPAPASVRSAPTLAASWPRPAPSARASAPAPAASVAAQPSCHIATEYDGKGQPHFKKVCE